MRALFNNHHLCIVKVKASDVANKNCTSQPTSSPNYMNATNTNYITTSRVGSHVNIITSQR